MDIIDFNLKNLLNIDEPTEVSQLNKQMVYELQLALNFLGYKLGSLDGIIGPKTLEAFKEFKRDTYQTNPTLIGKGSVGILIKLLDKEKDEIEQEEPHNSQSRLSSPLVANPDKINWNDFESPVSQYFTVGEFLRYDRQRMPNSTIVKNKIIKLAEELDKVRIAWGKPIGITSGYRPPAVNRRVGGARFSEHLTGSAADIYPIGGNIREFEKWLDARWFGALGYGSRKGFIHVDMRNNKGFNTGGSKGPRWNY